ncbi:hypothetical protein LARI1_G001816 [Lachnellula arida]|uniref:MYND-type domain-containing protein n=1 Tax=Lachnellula arida TaxID=1316785 RepID=A0A8T9BLA3_9HELO|nr:hypothetical protein LARI1_G001816 [Lachnellula arida]
MEIFLASSLNNEAIELERAGNYVGAEAKHLEALRLKIIGSGEHSIHVAFTRNGLGELYLKMGKLDDAQEQLEKAVAVREAAITDCGRDIIEGDNFDTACSRDNMGRMFEMRGDFEKSVAWRTKGAPNHMICSYFDCPGSMSCQFSRRTDLQACARCKAAFYCGKDCQRQDWKARHKVYCKASGVATPAAG